ncbi:MAG: hypothetical protein AYK18_00730 [Theionarchaea archaeon DG-70]|nr:MAG: hypothetical protein AYK18_00730 [Theionarchaea archaeon DG-70]
MKNHKSNYHRGVPYTYCIQFLDHVCTVTTHIDLLREWTPLLTPFFTIVKRESEAHINFSVEENPNTVTHLLQNQGSAPSIQLHCEATGRIVAQAPGRTTIVSPELQTVYAVETLKDQYSIEYMCKKFSTAIKLDLLRLVRGTLVGLTSEMRKVHMSVAAKEDGIAFVGGKNAGKTSFMLAFLKQVEGSAFLANDKTLLSVNNDTLTVWGLPYAVSIGFGALQCCDEIPVNEKTRIINDKAYFWPEELAEHLGRAVIPSSSLSAVVQVHIDPAVSTLTLREVPPQKRKKIVQEEITTFSDRVDPHWLLNLLEMTPAHNDRVTDLLVQKKWYTLYGNPWNGTLKSFLKAHHLI